MFLSNRFVLIIAGSLLQDMRHFFLDHLVQDVKMEMGSTGSQLESMIPSPNADGGVPPGPSLNANEAEAL